MFASRRCIRRSCSITSSFSSIHATFESNHKFSSVARSDVDHFRTEGFVKMEQFFDDDEFRAIRAGLIKLKNMGRLANVATEGDGVTHSTIPKNLQLCPLSPELPIFKSLPFNPKIASAMTELLHDESIGDEQDICCYLSQTFWKPPHHGLGTGIHQDNAYFLLEKPHFGTAFWIPTHRATKENGTLQVVKGFSKATDDKGTPIHHRRDGTSDHHITCHDEIMANHKEDIIDLEVDERGAICFNNNVPHGTGRNSTDHPRAAVAFHFLNMHHFKEREFPLPEGCEYVTPIIAGPNCSDGLKEYGYTVGKEQWKKDMEEILKEEEAILKMEQEIKETVTRSVKQDRGTV